MARSIDDDRILWLYLGIMELRPIEIGGWLQENTDRDNFYTDQELTSNLERYLKGRLGPVFER